MAGGRQQNAHTRAISLYDTVSLEVYTFYLAPLQIF